MVNAPGISLKVVVSVHFVLTSWAILLAWLPPTYAYMNAFILMIGVFAIVFPDSVDAVLLLLIVHLISILNDIVILSIYQPIADNNYERGTTPDGVKNTYRFSLGMCITNLILKPLTAFVLFRIYQDRGGEAGANWVPGLPNFSRMPGPYENIDQPVPTNTVETASPHHSIDTSSRGDPYMSKGSGEP